MTDSSILGWFLVGPMVTVCSIDAPTDEDALKHAEGWVSGVLPVRPEAWPLGLPEDGLRCTVCGSRIIS